MCVELVVNVEAHADGYVGQTVSIPLHTPDCTGHADPTPETPEPHEHTHEM